MSVSYIDLLLAKLPCVVAFILANKHTWTPKNTPAPKERIQVQVVDDGLAERWIQVEVVILPLLRVIFLALGLAEVAAIVLAKASHPLANQFVLSQDVQALQLDKFSAVGILFILAGTALRGWCYIVMGRWYTFEVAIREGHRLIQHGPYGIVRHPAYSGLGFIYIGYFFWFLAPGSWVRVSQVLLTIPGFLVLVPFFIFMFGVCVSLLYGRARREDKALKMAFGKEWEEYARKVTGRVIPGVY